MAKEKKDDGTGDPLKSFLEESLTQQRNERMDSFVQILRRLPTGDAYFSSGGTEPFQVQINFNVPISDGQIDTDARDKCLNLLEGFFFLSITFLIEKILLFHSSKSFPVSKIGGKLSVSKRK
jgi:hypothetical protein